jgi:hypothetical protein
MSESMKHSGGEHKIENHNTEHVSHKNLERIKEKAEKAEEHGEDHIDKIRAEIKTHAISGKEFTVGEKESTAPSSHHYTNQKELKANAYNKSMRQIRSKLSKPDKTFSKVIHNKTVESVSEVSSKTIARPSGLLGGGICALLGSAYLLYMTKHYGFEYNYFVFFLLFVGGFFVGMFGELLLRYVFRKT